MGLCAFVGGRIAIGRGSDPILISIATGGILCVLMLVICLSVFGAIPFHSKFLATILLTLAGSTLSGLLGDKKKRKKKKKK